MESYFIERLGLQGDGIATGPVYAPGALPGETVTGQRDGQVLRDVKIAEPVEARVKPPCPHAKSCGGCQLQHASDSFVADWKIDAIRRALAAHGIEAKIDGPVTSPARSRRRASFSAKRTKKGALAGFHMKGSDVVVSVPNCQLVVPELAAALPFVEDIARLAGSRKGEVSVQVTTSSGGLDLDVTGARPLDTELRSALADLARTYDVARIGWDGETALLRRPPEQQFDGITVIPPPGSFLQATQDGETALRTEVQAALAGCKRVVDLFAGCGTFALPLARTARVHAVEGQAEMIRALDHGWRNAVGLKQVTSETRDLFRNPLLPDELRRFDGAVIDPPRAGAEAQIVELALAEVPKIAHVSCNPLTFARDTASLMGHGYDLKRVVVVDQFRWSTHLEIVATLVKSD